MLAVLCPGQGSQSPGFLRPWATVPGVAERLAALADAAGFDLMACGGDPDADIVDTAVAQPLIVAAGAAVAATLPPLPAETVVFGHSIGELTAAAVTGVLDAPTAVALARIRGRVMAAAAAAAPSGMTAILGGDPAAVRDAVVRSGCWITNVNATGQVVAGGDRAALERLAADAPAGARLRPLPVAGAFHTPLMASAQEAFATAAGSLAPRDPRSLLLTNADGVVRTNGTEFLDLLVRQITAPVRFDRCLETLRALQVTAVLELAPAGVLAAIARRELPAVEVVALRSPEDLPAAIRLVDESTHVSADWSEPWQVVVAPAAGTFHRHGATGPSERRVGVVRHRGGESPVDTADATRLLEWLADDGDPVTQGQPLARVLVDGKTDRS